MKKIINKIKNNKLIYVIVGILIGLAITAGGVYAATVINASSVAFSGSTSGLTSTNLQDALNEAYTNADIRNRGNIVSAYTYNSSTCVTGEEKACVRTICYKSTSSRNCPAGTIIKYKVNDTDIVTFHVMYDNGTTMTMQSQKNTVNNTMWIDAADYATENTDSTSCSDDSCNDEGPMTVLVALERATKSWTNVNDQTYTMGTTTFKTNAYTGCRNYNLCTENKYTLDERTAKARMITLQEAAKLGCTTSSTSSCPKWMNNYLYNSTSFGGTESDSSIDQKTGSKNSGYWTMSAYSYATYNAWKVGFVGSVSTDVASSTLNGARAVVVVSK